GVGLGRALRLDERVHRGGQRAVVVVGLIGVPVDLDLVPAAGGEGAGESDGTGEVSKAWHHGKEREGSPPKQLIGGCTTEVARRMPPGGPPNARFKGAQRRPRPPGGRTGPAGPGPP